MARRVGAGYRVEELRSVAREGHVIEVDPTTSVRMSNIRQHGTTPELIVRKIVGRLGHRYRTVNRDLRGNPDLANRTRRWAIFVHGCFWHRHASCRLATTPTRNRAFWVAKFERNMKRDAAAIEQLEAAGYAVLVLWECETRDVDACASRLAAWFARALPR
jgi:DNA mismatch endonuclease (patch repair protein)